MADVTYKIELDDDQVLKALKVIDYNMRRLATEGDKSFSKVTQATKTSGVQIGLVSGVVQELTRRFINLAEEGARAFISIAAGGVELSKELELTQIALTNVLGGNQDAAEAFLDTIRQTARRLRTDYVELAQLAATILPQSNDIQATNQLLEQAIILGKQAGQSATGIRIALQEALAGQFTSLQRRLNVPASAIARIKSMSEEVGLVNALIAVLGDRVQQLGLSLDSTADTAAAAFATLESEGRRFQQILGEPILEALKEQAQALLEVLDEKGPAIEDAALAFGQFAAAVVELIGTNLIDFIDSLDFERIEKTADALHNLADASDILVKTLISISPGMNDELDRSVNLLNLMAAGLISVSAGLRLVTGAIESFPALEIATGLSTGNSQALMRGFSRATEEGAFNQDKFNQSMQETRDWLHEIAESLKENTQLTEERADTTEKDTSAALNAAQAYLQQQARLEELAVAEEKAAEASKKIAERTQEFIVDTQRKALEIQIGTERKRLDNEIKNAEAIEDIWRKHYDDLADAARDLSRDEEDVRRKAVRDEIEIERDAARERLSAETEYRRELQRIRDRFTMAAQEAERDNDAQAFLAAMRQRDQEVTEARRTRDETVQDAVTKAQEQRVALQQQLAFELEDARIANGRKLEDLQIRLNRELEEQAIKATRAEEERQREYQRELEDFSRKERQRLADLNQSLAKEVEMVRKAEALKRQIRVDEARATIAQVQSIMGQIGLRSGTPQQSLGSTLPPPSGRRLQEGGPAEAGRPYIVGERGPELFIPDRHGYVVPNAAIGGAVSNVSTVFNQQRSIAPTFNVAEDMFRNPVVVRRLQNLIMGVLVEAG